MNEHDLMSIAYTTLYPGPRMLDDRPINEEGVETANLLFKCV
jgi:hypothetical protein